MLPHRTAPETSGRETPVAIGSAVDGRRTHESEGKRPVDEAKRKREHVQSYLQRGVNCKDHSKRWSVSASAERHHAPALRTFWGVLDTG